MARPFATVAFPETIASRWVNDLVVYRHGQAQKTASLTESSDSKWPNADVLEENLVELVETIRRCHCYSVDFLASIISNRLPVFFGATDPRNAANRKCDCVFKFVLFLNGVHHPIETSLTINLW